MESKSNRLLDLATKKQIIRAKDVFALGIPRNYLLAHMWFNIAGATSSGKDQSEAIHARDDVAKAMTATQIADATAMAKKCRESEFKSCGK